MVAHSVSPRHLNRLILWNVHLLHNSVIVAIVLFRAALITSRQITIEPVEPVSIDASQAAERLAGAIRHKTISYQDHSQGDKTEFLRLHQYLKQVFPRVHATLTREVVSDYSLLYTWKGSSKALNPIVLMAHMDVVPVGGAEESSWIHPPFEGHL